MKLRKGFTLIELLVVIVIIGILATYLIPTIMGAPARARDAGRQSVLNGIKVALTSYYADYGHFPRGEVCITSGESFGIADDNDDDFTEANLKKYFEGGKLPDDPQASAVLPIKVGGAGSDCNGYYYSSVSAVDGGRADVAYIVAAIAEIQGNANQDCDDIEGIESLDSDNITSRDPNALSELKTDSDVADSHWCMMVTGS